MKRHFFHTVTVILFGAATVVAQERTLNFTKGQLISFVTSASMPDQDAARNEYFQKVFPMAAEHGFALVGSLDIQNVRGSDYQPYPLMNVFVWPSRQAEQTFQRKPEWAPLKAKRPLIWKELRICKVLVPRNMSLTFHAEKSYTIAFVWLSKVHPGDFDEYLGVLGEAVNSAGGKISAQFDGAGGSYHSLIEPPIAPDRVLIVEWPDAGARSRYHSSEAFRQHEHLLRSGLDKIETYETTFAFQSN